MCAHSQKLPHFNIGLYNLCLVQQQLPWCREGCTIIPDTQTQNYLPEIYILKLVRNKKSFWPDALNLSFNFRGILNINLFYLYSHLLYLWAHQSITRVTEKISFIEPTRPELHIDKKKILPLSLGCAWPSWRKWEIFWARFISWQFLNELEYRKTAISLIYNMKN